MKFMCHIVTVLVLLLIVFVLLWNTTNKHNNHSIHTFVRYEHNDHHKNDFITSYIITKFRSTNQLVKEQQQQQVSTSKRYLRQDQYNNTNHDIDDVSTSSSSSVVTAAASRSTTSSDIPFKSDYPPLIFPHTIPSSSSLSSTTTTLSYDDTTRMNKETCTDSCCSSKLLSQPSSSSSLSSITSHQDMPSCPMCDVCQSGNPLAFLPDAIQLLLMLTTIALSGIFAGLTLGFLSLDKTGLEILLESDDRTTKLYAQTIYPIRIKGNQLLCTLLLGNTASNALGSILIADWFGGFIGVISSTFAILIFGEIIPQAICSRYALYVGYKAVPLVRVIMFIFYPIAKPLAIILDYALGDEIATTYSSKEFMKLLQIHVEQNMIDHDTANTMTGALKYKNLPVQDVMTPLSNVFMLNNDEKLNFETIAKIFKAGYSRIPVYDVSPNNVVGLLFAKDLIFIDPEDETTVSDFIEIFGRGVHVVWPDDTLGDVLRELKSGRSHMALVRDVEQSDDNQDPYYEIKGIITLEDIIEEILGQEIVDETDAFVDGSHSVKLDREDVFNFARLRLLNSKIVDAKLSDEEARVVTAHLWNNYHHVVSLLSEAQLHRLVADTPVVVYPTAEQNFATKTPSDYIYKKDDPIDVCTLILSGKVTVLVGVDQFRSDVSSWSLLGAGALENTNYTPDFSAYVSTGPCRCIRISRSRFIAAADATVLERTELNRTLASSNAPPQKDEKELSRKTKLITALQAIDGDNKQNDPVSKPSRASSVTFAEPAALRRSNTIRATTLLSSNTKIKSSASQPTIAPSRFEFISAPSKKNLHEDETTEDTK